MYISSICMFVYCVRTDRGKQTGRRDTRRVFSSVSYAFFLLLLLLLLSFHNRFVILQLKCIYKRYSRAWYSTLVWNIIYDFLRNYYHNITILHTREYLKIKNPLHFQSLTHKSFHRTHIIIVFFILSYYLIVNSKLVMFYTILLTFFFHFLLNVLFAYRLSKCVYNSRMFTETKAFHFYRHICSLSRIKNVMT